MFGYRNAAWTLHLWSTPHAQYYFSRSHLLSFPNYSSSTKWIPHPPILSASIICAVLNLVPNLIHSIIHSIVLHFHKIGHSISYLGVPLLSSITPPPQKKIYFVHYHSTTPFCFLLSPKPCKINSFPRLLHPSFTIYTLYTLSHLKPMIKNHPYFIPSSSFALLFPSSSCISSSPSLNSAPFFPSGAVYHSILCFCLSPAFFPTNTLMFIFFFFFFKPDHNLHWCFDLFFLSFFLIPCLFTLTFTLLSLSPAWFAVLVGRDDGDVYFGCCTQQSGSLVLAEVDERVAAESHHTCTSLQPSTLGVTEALQLCHEALCAHQEAWLTRIVPQRGYFTCLTTSCHQLQHENHSNLMRLHIIKCPHLEDIL